MIKNKINKLILLIYLLTLGSYAHARVINVNQCPVPFDFTVADFCVLSTLGMWIIIPFIIFVFFAAIGVIKSIVSR
mgnify:CR=1 FL=1|tara:strand:+ start:239 stop:466 length:228 start_codon:yes stop_codon:yes gene_type:complete